jgi:hypothetical protein
MVLSYITCKIIWMFTLKIITLNQDLYIFEFKLHSNIRVHLLVCLKYGWLMHKHGTYRAVKFCLSSTLSSGSSPHWHTFTYSPLQFEPLLSIVLISQRKNLMMYQLLACPRGGNTLLCVFYCLQCSVNNSRHFILLFVMSHIKVAFWKSYQPNRSIVTPYSPVIPIKQYYTVQPK